MYFLYYCVLADKNKSLSNRRTFLLPLTAFNRLLKLFLMHFVGQLSWINCELHVHVYMDQRLSFEINPVLGNTRPDISYWVHVFITHSTKLTFSVCFVKIKDVTQTLKKRTFYSSINTQIWSNPIVRKVTKINGRIQYNMLFLDWL